VRRDFLASEEETRGVSPPHGVRRWLRVAAAMLQTEELPTYEVRLSFRSVA
jgi:hypothetical protein